MTAPFVSVVTPFYNTEPYLAQCIDSVLAQSHGDFEYLLVNNRSTDGSREVAAAYAARDPRIRLIDNVDFVGQVENYNGALRQIDPRSSYVKIVQADDALLPECLRLLVDVAERHPSVGLVGSLYLEGDQAAGAGIPRERTVIPGRELGRQMLLGAYFPIGSPSVVLYRAGIVRSRDPFYSLGRYHEDTEAAYEILLQHDFGFVHEVLSFLRTDNVSIMSAARRFNPGPLDYLISIERYGKSFLSAPEFEALRAREWRYYRGFLARSLVLRRDPGFWDYHRRGLATIGVTLRRRDLLPDALRALFHAAMNPGTAVRRGLANLGARLGHTR